MANLEKSKLVRIRHLDEITAKELNEHIYVDVAFDRELSDGQKATVYAHLVMDSDKATYQQYGAENRFLSDNQKDVQSWANAEAQKRK